MSITQTLANKLDSFWLSIDGKAVPIDHVLQTTLYAGVGVLGEPGKTVLTAQAYRMLNREGIAWNCVGKVIEFIINDKKSGERTYSGVVTSMNRIHHSKQDVVVISFDRPQWVTIQNTRWWKCFEKKTILQITKEFFEEHGIPFNQVPEDHYDFRGTHWENFCTPINGPTLPYLIEELKKDNFLLFTNPQDGGVIVLNWSDLVRLDLFEKLTPDYVLQQNIAKFDETNDVWLENTFTFGKQIGTDLPFKIQEIETTFTPQIVENLNHEHTFYTPLKKPQYFNDEVENLEANDIGYEKVEEYPGTQFHDVQIMPYPALRELEMFDAMGKTNYGEAFQYVNQSVTHPRYMYYRMQQSYARKIHLVHQNIIIPGSAKMVVPLTFVPVSYFENARVEDLEGYAEGDKINSGGFLIWTSMLSIAGPNIMNTLGLIKPYTHERLDTEKSDNKVMPEIEEPRDETASTQDPYNNVASA